MRQDPRSSKVASLGAVLGKLAPLASISTLSDEGPWVRSLPSPRAANLVSSDSCPVIQCPRKGDQQ